MRKIVIVLSSLQGGGAERVALNLYKGFECYPVVECHIVCLENVIDYDLPENIRLHILNLPRRNIFTAAFYKQWQARKIDDYIINNIGFPDLVLSNLTSVDKLMKFSRLPVLHVIHSTTSMEYLDGKSNLKASGIRRKIESIYSRHPIVCVSVGVMNDLKRNFSIRQSIGYIYNPVDVESVEESALRKDDESIINALGDYIIHVGTFKKAKDHELLVKAYKASGISEKLVLLGRTSGGTYEKTISLIKELHLQDKVFCLGFKANPYPYMKKAKLFVLSSKFEGFSCVLAEALALKVPVVSTDCQSGPAEILGGAYRHCLSPVGDVDALAANIRAALASPVRYTAPLRDEFRLESVVAQYMHLADMGKEGKLQ